MLPVLSPPHKSKIDLIRDFQSLIKDKESAQRWLTKSELVIPGEPITAATLSMALLYICNGKYDQKDLINGSCAVGLDSLHKTPNTDEITKKIASLLETKISILEDQIQKNYRLK